VSKNWALKALEPAGFVAQTYLYWVDGAFIALMPQRRIVPFQNNLVLPLRNLVLSLRNFVLCLRNFVLCLRNFVLFHRNVVLLQNKGVLAGSARHWKGSACEMFHKLGTSDAVYFSTHDLASLAAANRILSGNL
jgi:hypothetical protein